jgi:hypothetical protein
MPIIWRRKRLVLNYLSQTQQNVNKLVFWLQYKKLNHFITVLITNKGNIVAIYVRHRRLWQRCGHFRYAYRRYALGNIWKIYADIIISSDFLIWSLTPLCDLLNFACATPPHKSEQLCQVILKSLYACKSFAPDKRCSMTS